MRIVQAVLRRELTKYWRGKARIASGFAQPLLFLLIFGFGIQSMMPQTGGVNFAAYVFPGVLAMNVLGRSFASAIAVVYDGEQGFLREMLVAPASRVSIVVGAILGGSVTAMIQAALLFVAAPIMGVIPGPLSILGALGLVLLLGTLITALGVAGATFIRSVQTYQAISQTVMYPMLVLSGALFPMKGLPEWIQVIGKWNPATYPIDAMRRLLLEANSPDSPFFDLTGVTLYGHRLSVAEEVGITAGIALLLVAVGARGFGRAR
ncbi:MAG: ABC transporter permease [Micromonosporaceae bacterium]